jgi:hypothetical protein
MTPSQLTNEQKIAYLAEKVMGWQDSTNEWGKFVEWVTRYTEEFQAFADWNPLTDWNHWRLVEKKVMEDEELWLYYCTDLQRMHTSLTKMMEADLPTRADALISAHRSLHGE